jgi:hypothetical protein
MSNGTKLPRWNRTMPPVTGARLVLDYGLRYFVNDVIAQSMPL